MKQSVLGVTDFQDARALYANLRIDAETYTVFGGLRGSKGLAPVQLNRTIYLFAVDRTELGHGHKDCVPDIPDLRFDRAKNPHAACPRKRGRKMALLR